MNSELLFGMALGLQTPWQVDTLDFKRRDWAAEDKLKKVRTCQGAWLSTGPALYSIKFMRLPKEAGLLSRDHDYLCGYRRQDDEFSTSVTIQSR